MRRPTQLKEEVDKTDCAKVLWLNLVQEERKRLKSWPTILRTDRKDSASGGELRRRAVG